MGAVKCHKCNYPFKQRITSIKRLVGKERIRIVNVPSYRCSNKDCKQEFFADDVIVEMRKFVAKIKKQKIEFREIFNYLEILEQNELIK